MSEARLGDYLTHMREAAEAAIGFVAGISRDEFIADARTRQASS